MALLVAEANPAADADVAAHAVLAPLAGELYRHLRAAGVSPQRVEGAVLEMVAGLA